MTTDDGRDTPVERMSPTPPYSAGAMTRSTGSRRTTRITSLNVSSAVNRAARLTQTQAGRWNGFASVGAIGVIVGSQDCRDTLARSFARLV